MILKENGGGILRDKKVRPQNGVEQGGYKVADADSGHLQDVGTDGHDDHPPGGCNGSQNCGFLQKEKR